MSVSSTDKGLLTPDNCTVVFIDHQPQMFAGVTSTDRTELLSNVILLAKAAIVFGVPTILTSIEFRHIKDGIIPDLRGLFAGHVPIIRTSMNAWDSKEFVSAIRDAGRRNILIAALWSEASLVFPALQMMEEGYYAYVVENASGGTSRAAHDAAIRRVEQAGAVSLTALQVLLEFQRDWARADHYDEVMEVMEMHGYAWGQGPRHSVATARKERAHRRKKSVDGQ